MGMQLSQSMAQNSGQHSASSTPQSQTPTTPHHHGGPPTPTPVHHPGGPNQPQTPTPQQQAVMFAAHGVQNMSHGHGNNPYMPVLISNQPLHPQGGHNMHQGNLSHNGGNPHHGISSSQGPMSNVPVTLHQVGMQQGGMPHFQGQPPGRV